MTPNAYARRYAMAERETASSERLLVLLFQATMRHIRSGVAALEQGNPGEAGRVFRKASDIVLELHHTLDHSRAPVLCDRLSAVYRFVCLRLGTATMLRSVTAAREAERVLAPVADAFEKAVLSLAATPR